MKNIKINIFFLFLLTAATVMFIGQGKLFAHCDTLDGPVIQDARTALEKGDVTPVLKWVKKDAEQEIRVVFDKTLAERKSNKDAADIKFFETLVRIHRAGEGASFTGLKPSGTVEAIIAGADKALETGSIDALTQEMATHLTSGVKERFERAFELRKHKDESVEAGREYVEAYVEYVHYVEGLHDMIGGKEGHNHEE
ncbi:MAG: hypothetical protein C4533_07830 [Candidatus Omnitrophota bacterium]|nr:MAG: hypothetical protein C4533_07830 [Candidatus Omnitrophota bacterium]